MTHLDAGCDSAGDRRARERRAAHRRLVLMCGCVAVMFFGLGSAFGAELGNPPSEGPRPAPTVTVTETAAP
ncbi:hypothetical protein [Peterkaempfera griseoplana]|uniref:hypothetical protein n=1 Tax=Peterkaempfera griseoplana TaxID=66896 RepID=UPI0006E2F0CB|nr:hypothetical protein [Peterkaempfera griseoplana]